MNCLKWYMCWQSKRICWQEVPGQRAGVLRNPGGLLCHKACSQGFYGVTLVSWLSLANYSDSGSFNVVRTLVSQGRFQWGGFWELGSTCGVSFWPFLNSSWWWWLVSSAFLIRTSCCQITLASGYYRAWPVQVVSFSISPNSNII